jgi:hypothetical protein
LSHRATCGITANLSDLYTAHHWAVATLMSSYIFIVASLPLPHSCGIMLLWKQYETIQGFSCGITTDFDCGITADLSDLYTAHHWAVATLMSSYIFIVCHFHTPVGLCCYESSMRPYKVFLAASLPTLIAASCRLYLRHYCRLDSSSMLDVLQHRCRLDSLSCRATCGVIADLIDLYSGIVVATPTLLWDYAAMKAVWDQTCLGCRIIADLIFIIVASLPLPHLCGIMLLLVAVWDQTWSGLWHLANLNRRLVGQLAESLPTWLVVL